MFRRVFQFLLLVLLSFLVTDEVQGMYFFKGAPNAVPNQFRKRVYSSSVSQIFAWCSEVCDTQICRVVEATGRFDVVYSDCECGLHCYCLFSEFDSLHNAYIYRCMPA